MGFNYGWDEDYECVGTELIAGMSRYVPPLLSYEPTIAPTGIMVYDGDSFSGWTGDVFFCSSNFGTMRRIVLNEGRSQMESVHEVDLGGIWCSIEVLVGPDGGIYFASVGPENTVGIYRILPMN